MIDYTRALSYRLPLVRGEDVVVLQQRLKELGYDEVGNADGLFGHKTEAVVRAFQGSHGLKVDGIVGPLTWEVLFEAPETEEAESSEGTSDDSTAEVSESQIPRPLPASVPTALTKVSKVLPELIQPHSYRSENVTSITWYLSRIGIITEPCKEIELSSDLPNQLTEIFHILSKPDVATKGNDEWIIAEKGNDEWVITDKASDKTYFARKAENELTIGKCENTGGEPETVERVWSRFGVSVEKWGAKFGIPVELIVATICTESRGDAEAVREEPGYISDNQTPNKVSPGLMQTLISTARETLADDSIDRNWLLVADNSIRAGTAYIARQWKRTHLDPPKVACAYNAGSVYENTHPANRWKMKQYPINTDDHADRFIKWFNDCFRFFEKKKLSPLMSFHRQLNPKDRKAT